MFLSRKHYIFADLIFVIFPPQMYFWVQFFSTWKLHKFCIYGKVFYITDMTYVQNFRFLHICHVETSEISSHVEKFSISSQLSYMESWNLNDNFSPLIILVILVTNNRSVSLEVTRKKICNFFCKGRPAITWSQQETNESGGSTRLNSKIWHWSPRYRVLRGRSGQDPVTTMHNTGWTNHSSGLVWILRFWICDHIGAINSHFPVYEAIFSMVRMANRVILKQACSWPVVTQEDYAGCLCHILHIGYTQIEAKL